MTNKLIEIIEDFDPKRITQEEEEALMSVSGMIGLGTRYLIRLLCQNVTQGHYLELGTHKGSSLFAAATANRHITCIGVDSFEREYEPRNVFEASIESQARQTLSPCENVAIMRISSNFFWGNVVNKSFAPPPVEVYFYDASHEYFETFVSLLLCDRFLVDGAIILVDDVDAETNQQIRDAINAAVVQHNGKMKVIKDFEKNEFYQNGLMCLSWDSKA